MNDVMHLENRKNMKNLENANIEPWLYEWIWYGMKRYKVFNQISAHLELEV